MIELCESSAGCGDYVCCLVSGHEGPHGSREYGNPARSLWASWDDFDADDEPYACHHEELEHLGHTRLRLCTRCGAELIEVEDPAGSTTVETIPRTTVRRVRYDCARCDDRACRGCRPSPNERAIGPDAHTVRFSPYAASTGDADA